MRYRSWIINVVALTFGATSAAKRPSVKPGIQVLFEKHEDVLKGKNVGLISNPTGVLPNLTSDVEFLQNAHPEIEIKALFAPEQGFRGAQQAGQSSGGYKDPNSGLEVYSLYGNTSAEINDIFDQAGIDTILLDLQDVGARFYTYAWTMADTMEGIAGTDKTLVVLDRPNPIGGRSVEGPVVRPGYESFVGRYPIAMQHGMTMGELAVMFNEEFVPKKTDGKRANVQVIWMDGWDRDMYLDDTGLPFVMPSVNLPTLDSLFVYPGYGMFEGTVISEGRGTTHPFEIIGAPFINYTLVNAMVASNQPGATFIESDFVPTFEDFANQTCVGTQTYVTDREKFSSINTALEEIVMIRNMFPQGFDFSATFDRLTGSDSVRKQITEGKSAKEIIASWQPELNQFKQLREKYLHYTDRVC